MTSISLRVGDLDVVVHKDRSRGIALAVTGGIRYDFETLSDILRQYEAAKLLSNRGLLTVSVYSKLEEKIKRSVLLHLTRMNKN